MRNSQTGMIGPPWRCNYWVRCARCQIAERCKKSQVISREKGRRHIVRRPSSNARVHARDDVRISDRHSVAYAERMRSIGAAEIGIGDEMFARRQKKCPHVALVPEVAASDRVPEPVPALAEKAPLFAAASDHPLDEAQFVIHRWRGVPVVRDRDVGLGGKAAHRQGGGSSEHETAPAEQRAELWIFV